MKFVVIGASAAGITAVQKLRECNPESEITLISRDTEVYSRCILYHHLDQTRTLEEMNFAGIDFDSRLHIRWIKGTNVTSIDVEQKVVHTDQDLDVPYDKLCIAAGSHTNFPHRGYSFIISYVANLPGSERLERAFWLWRFTS